MENSKIYTALQLENVKSSTRKWLDDFHCGNRSAMVFPFILNERVKAMILDYNPDADLSPFDDGGSWIYDGRTNPKERAKAFAAFCIRNIPLSLNFKDFEFWLNYTVPENVKMADSIMEKLVSEGKSLPRRRRLIQSFTEDDFCSLLNRLKGSLSQHEKICDLYEALISRPATQTAEAVKA